MEQKKKGFLEHYPAVAGATAVLIPAVVGAVLAIRGTGDAPKQIVATPATSSALAPKLTKLDSAATAPSDSPIIETPPPPPQVTSTTRRSSLPSTATRTGLPNAIYPKRASIRFPRIQELAIYEEPSTTSKIVATFSPREVIFVGDQRDGWWAATTSDGRRGYVSQELVKLID